MVIDGETVINTWQPRKGRDGRPVIKASFGLAHSPPSNTVQELASFTIAVDKDTSEEVEICLSCTDNHGIKASQLTSNEARLHSASITFSSTSTEASNVAMIARSDLQKSESQSWHLDSACSRHLTFEKNVFVGNLTESSTGIECANGNHPTAKSIGNIKLSCLNEDSLESLAAINDVLDLPEAKANLLSLGQLSEQGVDMKIRGPRMYLHRGGKTIITGSRIERVWLMNSINWPMRALYAREVVTKALKNGKNDILHARLGHMGETHGKKIISMVDDIDGDPTKICFYDCKSCTGTKITQNPSNKPMSEVTTKLDRVHMDFWGLSP